MWSFLNRPVGIRNIIIILVSIFVMENAIFTWAYMSKSNPVKTLGNKIPYSLAPTAPNQQTLIYGPVADPLNKPMAVTMVNRQIYVSDTNNQRIQIFDYDGNPLITFGSYGKEKGQFSFPYGVAGDSQGNIYVADLYNGKISVFTSDGQFINYFGNGDDFTKPAGLFIDGERLYLTDLGKHQVLVYSLDGTKLQEIGKKGNGDGELTSPNCVTHNRNKIYVSDTGNDRIVIFDEQGNFLTQFNGSSEKNKNSLLINPRGIAVDSKGLIYVVSNITNRVEVFNEKGERVFSFGGKGNGDGQFKLPNGLSMDDQGRIYVTDTVNARVAIYQ